MPRERRPACPNRGSFCLVLPWSAVLHHYSCSLLRQAGEQKYQVRFSGLANTGGSAAKVAEKVSGSRTCRNLARRHCLEATVCNGQTQQTLIRESRLHARSTLNKLSPVMRNSVLPLKENKIYLPSVDMRIIISFRLLGFNIQPLLSLNSLTFSTEMMAMNKGFEEVADEIWGR